MGIEAIRWKALQALRPPADLPLADWIEGHIFLPQNASAMPWTVPISSGLRC